jgi:hypothetical protein
MVELVPRRVAPYLAGVVVFGLAAAAWVVPLETIRAAYAVPPPLTCPTAAGSRGPGAAPVALVAAEAPKGDLHPGDRLEASLCWLAQAPPGRVLSASAQLVAPGEQVLALHDGFPGGGNDATLWWQPGSLHEDKHAVTVPDWAPVPTVAELRVDFLDMAAEHRLPSIAPDGRDFVVVGRYRIVGDARPPPLPGPERAYEDGTKLLGAEVSPIGDRVGGTIYFGASRVPRRSHTVSVQLVGPRGLVAQDDRLPRGGLFPTTDWRPGDVVPHEFALTVPAPVSTGRYQLLVVMYDLPERTRLRAGADDYVELAALCSDGAGLVPC